MPRHTADLHLVAGTGTGTRGTWRAPQEELAALNGVQSFASEVAALADLGQARVWELCPGLDADVDLIEAPLSAMGTEV